MTLPAKRLLYVLVFLAFASISPLVVLYSWGYRYNFIKQQVEVTGILYLKSYPRRAAVTLNGRLVPYQTPAQITGLHPGLYDAEITFKDMQTWRKTLPVKPQLATFAEDIVLFRSEPRQELIDKMPSVAKLGSSPDGHLLATITRGDTGPALELRVRDISTNQVIAHQTIAPSLAPYDIVWSENGRRLAIVGTKQALAIVIGNSLNPIVITPPLTGPWLSMQWDDTNDNALYAPSIHGLYRFDLGSKSWLNISRDSILGLLQRGNSSMVVMATSGSAWLRPWPLTANDWRLALSSSTNAVFIGKNGYEDQVSWHSGTNAWLVDASSSRPLINGYWRDAQAITWAPNYSVFAILRPNDIELIHQQDQVTSTIPLDNSSGLSTTIFWYPGGTHLYLSQPGHLEVAEIDPRGQRNRHTLIQESDFNGLSVPSYDSTSIYWLRHSSSTSTVSGLYRAVVQ
jgi:hypothetical protein